MDHFKRSYEAGRLAQAYIVAGQIRGEALEFTEQALSLLFCKKKDGNPCGECADCRQIKSHVHPDVLWVEPQKKSRIISVDQIKEDIEVRMMQTSFGGTWKTCVLAAADRMSAEASNAFLKTLEEPSGKSVFFLITDNPGALLPTVRSRCQRIMLSIGDTALSDDVRDVLVDILASCGLDVKSGAKTGVIEQMVFTERLVNLLKDMKKKAEAEEWAAAENSARDEDDETVEARASARYREERSKLMRFVLRWYRDILMIAQGCDDKILHHSGHIEILKKKARGLSGVMARRNVETVMEMDEQMARNLPESSVLSFGMSKIS